MGSESPQGMKCNMDVLSKPVRMSPEMGKLLDKMRSDDQPYPIDNQPSAEADAGAWHAA